jgi:branched-chain amino acid transport system substrate-binding protein
MSKTSSPQHAPICARTASRRKRFALGFGVAVALVAGTLTREAPAQGKPPYVLGAVLSLSGPVAANGVPTKDGIEVAVKEINAVGGIDGHPIEVMFEDDQSKPDQAVILATKLMTQDNVPLLFSASFGSTANAVASVAEKNKVPQLSPTAWTKAELRSLPYTFYFLADFESVVDRMLTYSTDVAKAKRIGILRLSREYGQIASESFRKLKDKYGVEIVREERGTDADTDFTPQLTNIRAANPELVVLWFANPAGAIAIKNARQLGIKTPLLGPVSMATRPTATAGGRAAEGTIIQSFIAPDDPLPRQKRFVEMFQKERGKLPEVFESVGYDMVQVASRALKSVGGEKPDREKLREALSRTQYEGVAVILKYTDAVHEPETASIMFTKVENGKFVQAATK